MGSPTPDRKTLEELWRQRLNDAKLRVDFARHYMVEVQNGFTSPDIPAADGDFAFRKALRGENMALAEYNRILRIYADLTARGVIPDWNDWFKAQAANAGGSESKPE